MPGNRTQTLLIQGTKWEILQHLKWLNGNYFFFIEAGSPVDSFNLDVSWSLRPDMTVLIGSIRLLEEGSNTRIIFITKPFPTSEGPDKFEGFITRIREYFGETIIQEDEWQPTGLERIDRNVSKIKQTLFTARNEEDFQTVGLLCREAIISLGETLYQPERDKLEDGSSISKTDANRIIGNFISTQLLGSSNEEIRKYVKDCFKLAVTLQHMRNASWKEAALCVEAIRSLLNIIAIISGNISPLNSVPENQND